MRNAQRLLEQGLGPVLLPAQDGVRTSRRGCGPRSSRFVEGELGLDPGTVKTTVLIETLPAAFEMEEILYELRDALAAR